MSDAEYPVKCASHGSSPATFVCVHLVGGVACGFHGSAEDPTDRWPDAWCDLCEAAFQREGDWNESNTPELKVLCTHCYETVRKRNESVPAPLRLGQLSMTEDEFRSFARATFDRCDERQRAAMRRWPLFKTHKRWFYDAEASTIRFYDSERDEYLLADISIAGSFSTRSNSWMWVWGNDVYSDAERSKIDPIRVLGEVRGIEKLASTPWPADEVDGWEMTQIAAALLGAEAIFRMPSDHLMVFMLLDRFRLVHPS
jgi:hypothetical protein